MARSGKMGMGSSGKPDLGGLARRAHVLPTPIMGTT
jgi:hypothetical protein